MMKNVFLFFLLIISYGFIDAQSFRYEAKVDAVDSSGFYKIYLAPEINSKLHDGFFDLRLSDNEGKETPYLVTTESLYNANEKFVNYEIKERKNLKDSATIITIRNKSKVKIDNISLQIKNADVNKQIKISGSDDQQKWYVVKDFAEFNLINNTSEVTEFKLFDFPLTDYEYYRIEVDDKKSKPINILSAGYYENVITNGAYTEIVTQRISYTDSLRTKSTWVTINLKDSTLIDLIKFSVAAPKYFLRVVDLFKVMSYKNENAVLQFLKTTEIKSGDENKIIFRPIMVKSFMLRIPNEDNPPLKFVSIKCFQLNSYALTYLEKSKSYTLRFGNDSIKNPDYDLKHFQNAIPQDVAVINTNEVIKIKLQPSPPIKQPYTFFSDKRFIWVMIALIIVFLGVITFRMLRE